MLPGPRWRHDAHLAGFCFRRGTDSIVSSSLTAPLDSFPPEKIANNVPEKAKADEISVDELRHNLIADANAVGIKRIEIDEDVDSLYRTILDAIVHYEPGPPE